MIVRCNNCLSAFSVNDDKVADKIFAFTCPKCDTENIINNKIKDKQTAHKESVLDDDFIDSDNNRKLNLEIEESGNIHDIEVDDSIFEEFSNDEPARKKEDASPSDFAKFVSQYMSENKKENLVNDEKSKAKVLIVFL